MEAVLLHGLQQPQRAVQRWLGGLRKPAECGKDLPVRQRRFLFLETEPDVTALDNGRIDCSARCRAAVNAYGENSWCCTNYWRFSNHLSGPSIEDIFTACQVEFPGECANYNTPPSDFLDCARAGQSALSAVIFTATLSLLLALLLQ